MTTESYPTAPPSVMAYFVRYVTHHACGPMVVSASQVNHVRITVQSAKTVAAYANWREDQCFFPEDVCRKVPMFRPQMMHH